MVWEIGFSGEGLARGGLVGDAIRIVEGPQQKPVIQAVTAGMV